MTYKQWIEGGCGCESVTPCSKKQDVCDCENILLELSKQHTDDLILQDEIDYVSGITDTKLDESAYTPVDLSEYYTKSEVDNIADTKLDASAYTPTDLSDYYTKEQVDALIPEVPSLSGYATEQWVEDKHYITGVDLSDYATKDEIPVIPTNVNAFINDAKYVTESTLIQYITSLTDELNSLKSTISGCCSPTPPETLYRWITMTGENDYWCSGTTKMSEEKEQSSSDGINWTDTGTIRSGSTILEQNCVECGYVPEHYKLYITKTDNSPYIVNCNGDSEAKTSETHYGIDSATIKEAVIGDCVDSLGNKLFSYCTSLSAVTIPSGVTTINTGAFYVCTSLSSVTIPNTVTFIGQEAFSGCTSLKNVNIPNGIEDVKANTFAYTNVENISIPNSVNRILNHSFDHCTNLKNVTIGTGCTVISMAFTYCTGLQTVTINATTPPSLLSKPFENTNNTFIIKVPSASVNTYKTRWSEFASRIQAI